MNEIGRRLDTIDSKITIYLIYILINLTHNMNNEYEICKTHIVLKIMIKLHLFIVKGMKISFEQFVDNATAADEYIY